MAELQLDSMEYANDAAAQAAYVTNTTSIDIITGGVASADSAYNPSYIAANASDNNLATRWASANTAFPHWWKYDLGAGVAKAVFKLNIFTYKDANGAAVKNFTLQGSNDNINWTTVYTGICADLSSRWQDFTFSNSIAYRYYKINLTDNYRNDNCVSFYEIEIMEVVPLQSYSESVIKTQGTYALKGMATTESLNKTLTRTFSTNSDLSGVNNLKFDIRASRTGSNIKIGIYDTGGVTTEITPNIVAADTFQTVVWDISAVADVNKDAISKIIITIVNADVANTFYLDYMEIAQEIALIGVFGIVG